MNIAAITITYNDGYKFSEWFEHYQLYKDELYLHIIVDNGSKPEYLNLVETTFVNSYLIKRTSNGGCTAAYNDGIKMALSDPAVDAIMLVGNDIKIESGGITKCYSFLKSNPKLGMIGPIILEKDSLVVNNFGCGISDKLTMILYMSGKSLTDICELSHYSEAVSGGMNISTREFYETVGMQDENLFMYSDEVDMGIRAKKHGFLMASTKEAVAWHQHINENIRDNKRHPFSTYLIARNKVYLAKKHFGKKRALMVFSYFILTGIKSTLIMLITLRFSYIKDFLWQMLGALYGFIGKMKSNRFSVLN